MFDDLESFSNIPNFLNTFSKDQCAKLDSGGHPFNLVEMGGINNSLHIVPCSNNDINIVGKTTYVSHKVNKMQKQSSNDNNLAKILILSKNYHSCILFFCIPVLSKFHDSHIVHS